MNKINPTFTDIQNKITSLLIQGKTNPEIAKHLFLSEVTVKKHLSAMFLKLGVKNRTQLVQLMMQHE